MTNKEFCNINELSNCLKISTSKIRGLVRKKKIPHFRTGNRIMFDLININSWVEELENKARASVFETIQKDAINA